MLPLLAAGLWGYTLNESAKQGAEARADRERERKLKEQEIADQQELRNVAAVQEPVIKEAADGIGPSAVMVGKEGAFGTEKEAQAFADQYNSPEARINRQRDALIGQGKATDGMNLEKGAIGLDSLRRTAAKVLRDEGVNDFIDANFARMPSVEDVKAGKAKLFDLAGVDKYNSVGADKLPEGTKGRWKVMTLPNGRELVDFEAVDASGNSLTGPYSARVLQMIHNQTPEQRETTEDARFKDGRDYALRREQLDAQKAYWDRLGAAAETRADKAGSGGGKGGSLFDRMDEADKLAFKEASEQAKYIQRAIIDSTAENAWDPAKNENQFALVKKLEAAQRKANDVLARYSKASDTDAKPKADPYNIRDEVDASLPPSFNVSGNPASFRKSLVGKVPADVLAAFDAKYPQAKPKLAQAPAFLPAANMRPEQAQKQPPPSWPSVVQRLGAFFTSGPAAPDWNAQAESALLGMDRWKIQMLLKPGSESERGMSPEMKLRLRAALKN